jgi:hypothetical protein
MRNVLVLLPLLLLPSLAASALAGTTEQIGPISLEIATGRSAAFGPAVAPAQSLDLQLTPAARIETVVARVAQEVEQVTTAFADAPAADKIAKTKAAVAAFSPETAQDGASRSFEGNGPSLSIMRQLLFVPATAAEDDPVARLMALISGFERSPKTDDMYYEYSNPADLKNSSITDLPGSDGSWTTDARPPMLLDNLYALKKCRHIVLLGWYCNTSMYQVRKLAKGDGSAEVLLTVLHSLPPGADSGKFQGGKAENVVDGYTAVYVVARSGDLVLVYSLGIQSKASPPSHQQLLNSGHKEEYRQLVSRIEAELKIAKLPF